MGLDFSIRLVATHKTADFKKEFEMAYWRKHYGLRDLIIERARETEFLIDKDEDWLFRTTPYFIFDIIENIGSQLWNVDNPIFVQSIWGKAWSRHQTIEELDRMCAWASLIDEFYNLKNCRIETRNEYIEMNCERIFDILENYYEQEELDSLTEILKNIDEYDFSLEIINSY